MKYKLSRRSPARALNEVFGLPFTQAEVDFVIPDLAGDLRLGIDPFLLFKSRDPELRGAHDRLLRTFNRAIEQYAKGHEDAAARIIDFPEVNEIGLGYRESSDHGSGMGTLLNQLLLSTLGESPELVRRGVRHIEEMQLVALGINADRVSDITANLLKGFLIEYTQRQAEQYGIPITKGVPVEHVFDFDAGGWRDDYYDLPLNPLSQKPRGIILVPRRIVRLLPWINFDDFQRMEFGLYLRAKASRKTVVGPGSARRPGKEEIVAVTRREVGRIDHYVDAKEREAHRADPEALVKATPEFKVRCDGLIDELRSLSTGQGDAYRYQGVMFRILNRLFEPDLIEGRTQARTVHGTEIRDILFTNDSDKPFWDFVRNTHGSLTVVFECKNTAAVDNGDVDQLAGYLGDALGYFGIILGRQPMTDPCMLKCIAWYNKGTPHRVMIALADEDVVRMLQIKASAGDPTQIVRYKYQELLAKIQ
jgi:hypothetical protein